MDRYEVGFGVLGIPTSELKRKALNELLDACGRNPELWFEYPSIRIDEMGTTSPDWGRKPLEVTNDAWAVYGIMNTEPPAKYYVPEGVRIPTRDILE